MTLPLSKVEYGSKTTGGVDFAVVMQLTPDAKVQEIEQWLLHHLIHHVHHPLATTDDQGSKLWRVVFQARQDKLYAAIHFEPNGTIIWDTSSLVVTCDFGTEHGMTAQEFAKDMLIPDTISRIGISSLSRQGMQQFWLETIDFGKGWMRHPMWSYHAGQLFTMREKSFEFNGWTLYLDEE
jgi:hypothetical protein